MSDGGPSVDEALEEATALLRAVSGDERRWRASVRHEDPWVGQSLAREARLASCATVLVKLSVALEDPEMVAEIVAIAGEDDAPKGYARLAALLAGEGADG